MRIPHVSTLNALATFLDYENWNEFKTKLKNEIKPAIINSNSSINKKKVLLKPYIISFLLLIIVSFLFYSLTNSNRKRIISKHLINKTDLVFTSKKTVLAGLPNTVVFNYDLSKIAFDSAFIQQDWDKRRRRKIVKENHFHNCIYYYPGFYTAKLIVDDQTIKTFPLFIETNGWIAVYEKKYYQEVPIYLKNIDLIKNKSLYVSVADLKTNQIENDKDFYIAFYNARDFGNINCDNFSLETEVKNNPKDGGLTCGYTSISIQGKDGMMTAKFSEKGCTSEVFINFGNVYLAGSKNDLSAFGTDLLNWRNIKYKVVNKQVKILIDNKEIYQLKYDKEIGKLTSISFHFYGCGAVRMVKLFDKDNKVVYDDDFK